VFQYVLLRYAVRDDRQFRRVVIILSLAVVVQACSAIVQWYTGVGLGGIEVLVADGVRRVRGAGIFNDPNDLALTLVTAIPLVIVLASDRQRGMLQRSAFALSVVPIVVALYFTNSRGGIIAFAAVMLVLAYQRFGTAAATAAAVVGLTLIVAAGPSRTAQFDTGEESAQERIEAWSEGLQMFKSRPLTGVGWNRFMDYHERVAHNSFVHTLAELGLFGGFFFVGLAYSYFQSLRMAGSANDQAAGRAWTNGLIASGAGLYAGATFLSRQYNPGFYMIIALGSCYAGSRGAAAGYASRPHDSYLFDLAIVAILEVAGIAAAYIAVFLLRT